MSSTKHIGHQVIAMMDRLGVSPIARNYHLFYTCIANSNPAMRRAMRNLGRFPTQGELDRIIEEFCPDATGSPMLQRQEHSLLRTMADLASRLGSEQVQMTSFHRAMERMTSALEKSAEQDLVAKDLMLRVVNVIGEVGKSRVNAGARTLTRMDQGKDEISALRDELIAARRLANTDALTGLANRRHFDDTLAQAVDGTKDVGLILADIDHFKRLNDAYGHAFGDHVLKSIAITIKHATRQDSFVARVGGEEFAIVIPHANDGDAMSIAERIRVAIENMLLRNDKDEIAITISIGVATSRHAQNSDQLYEAADAALYRSKNAGRNCSTLFDPAEDERTSNRYRIYAQ